MRQTWDEQADSQAAYLRHIRRDEVCTLRREMRKWRRRCLWSLAVNVLLLVLWLRRSCS